MSAPAPLPASDTRWTSRRTVVVFGLVSLAADMVYEGMRSIAGPFLGSLGASALTVGIVTGAGEAIALLLRLGTGAWADRSGRYWRLTVLGYALTVICVPLLAIAPALGAAGIGVATVLILLERTGKAIRSPAKSTLLAGVAGSHDLGRAFGIHKALDQVGAFAGPLVVAGMATATGLLWPGFVVLAGVAVWGAAGGVLDSTVKAQVAAVVPVARLGGGYGVFAAIQGVGAILGGVAAGALVTEHRVTLSVGVVVVQAVAVVLIAVATRKDLGSVSRVR